MFAEWEGLFNMETTEAIARNVISCMNELNFDRLRSLFRADAEWHIRGRSPVSRRLPIGEFAEVMRNFADSPRFGGMKMSIRSLMAQETSAAVEWESVITWKDGGTYDNCGVFVLDVENGAINGAREYLDTYWSTRILVGSDGPDPLLRD